MTSTTYRILVISMVALFAVPSYGDEEVDILPHSSFYGRKQWEQARTLHALRKLKPAFVSHKKMKGKVMSIVTVSTEGQEPRLIYEVEVSIPGGPPSTYLLEKSQVTFKRAAPSPSNQASLAKAVRSGRVFFKCESVDEVVMKTSRKATPYYTMDAISEGKDINEVTPAGKFPIHREMVIYEKCNDLDQIERSANEVYRAKVWEKGTVRSVFIHSTDIVPRGNVHPKPKTARTSRNRETEVTKFRGSSPKSKNEAKVKAAPGPFTPFDTNCKENMTEHQCLVCNCYFESRGEPYKGKVAVSRVVLSRKKSDNYPKSACEVIWQERQFSWTQDGKSDLIRTKTDEDVAAVGDCRRSVDEALADNTFWKLMFHANNVSPRWSRDCSGREVIGRHIFYTRCGEAYSEGKPKNGKGKTVSQLDY